MAHADPTWWRGGVLYQIYPRSFRDSDGDGVGDLRGIFERLDHIDWLGVDGIWLSPTFPSPNDDWGYDVADYRDVHPELGTLADLDRLVAEAGARGIRVLLDLVPNHTSDRHPWFADERRREWYVWADAPPNNWTSVFGGSAWERDEATGRYYLHNFLRSMPDLNWWNEEVRREFEDILRFWLERGIAGFRIDVAHGLIKDRELRDNPPAGPEDAPLIRRLGQKVVFSLNRPEVHEIYREWRRLTDGFDPPRVLLGETYVMELDRMAAFYGTGEDELHLAMNFPFALAPFRAAALRRIVEATEAVLPPGGWPVWFGSNHDLLRFPSRWCRGDERKVRCALLVLLALRGTPILYYGDEIGMPATPLRKGDLRDPARPNRDPSRTPMHWSAGPGGGFGAQGPPWLPYGDFASCNVESQRDDPGSVLRLCRDLIALRTELAELRDGAYRPLSAPRGAWAWRRGDGVTVAVNLSDREKTVPESEGVIRLCTTRAREGERVRGRLRLGVWEAAILVG